MIIHPEENVAESDVGISHKISDQSGQDNAGPDRDNAAKLKTVFQRDQLVNRRARGTEWSSILLTVVFV